MLPLLVLRRLLCTPLLGHPLRLHRWRLPILGRRLLLLRTLLGRLTAVSCARLMLCRLAVGAIDDSRGSILFSASSGFRSSGLLLAFHRVGCHRLLLCCRLLGCLSSLSLSRCVSCRCCRRRLFATRLCWLGDRVHHWQ